MNPSHALAASRPRLVLLFILTLAVLALSAFALGAEASAKATGGISAASAPGGGSGSAGEANSSAYARLWSRVPAREKRWARATSRCESGGDPDAIGGGGAYRGAFQFLKSTWRTSPKSPGGDPIDYDYRTQAVVAVLLKKRDGAGHWPVCG